jgi:hypothetical protein
MTKEGTITFGEYSGWRLKIQPDERNTGGFYLLAFNPMDPSSGWDEWYESEQDIATALSEHSFQVTWDTSGENGFGPNLIG